MVACTMHGVMMVWNGVVAGVDDDDAGGYAVVLVGVVVVGNGVGC